MAGSFDLGCNFKFYDLDIPFLSYKIILVESFDLICNLMFYDLAIPFDLMQDLDPDNIALYKLK